MKKSMGIMGVLIIALSITGCAEGALPNESTDKTGQSLESEAQGEMTERNSEEGDDQKLNAPEQQEITENNVTETLILSEEDLARMRSIAEEHYTSMNRKMLSFTQADPALSYNPEYEGYEPDEVVLFEVIVENSEAKRYIIIGSKDGWNNCSILDEGY